jgi:hypothetical protein
MNNRRNTSTLMRLTARLSAFVYGVVVIAPGLSLAWTILMVWLTAINAPMVVRAIAIVMIVPVAFFITHRLYSHAERNPRRHIRPIVREIKRFMRELESM